MDVYSTTIVGSRHPVLVPLPARESSSSGSTADEPETPQLAPIILAPSSSSKRRKPTRTYKSIVAHESISLNVEGSQYPTDVLEINGSHEELVNPPFSIAEPYIPPLPITGPPLPLYHPQGVFALSLPELDPSEFGLPNPINIDDNDERLDGDLSRRASSRARRPAAKLRDRDRNTVDEELLNGVALELPKVGDPQARSASPRKRRSGGASGKRRRKETDDADGTYPNPPKRTRNPRAVVAGAAASPLAGPALAADDAELDASAIQEGQDIDEIRSEVLDAPEPKQSTRSRRKAPALRRRGSSASDTTTTSISISIAANAKKPSIPVVPLEEQGSEVQIPPPLQLKDSEENPSTSNNQETVQEEPKTMDSSASVVTSPSEVPMDIETTSKVAEPPKETVEESAPDTTAAESSTAANEAGDSMAVDLPPPPSAGVEQEDTSPNPNIDDTTASVNSTKNVPSPTSVSAPIEAKSPTPPLVSTKQSPKPPVPVVSPPARQPNHIATRPPQPPPIEEKEEGELSEDG